MNLYKFSDSLSTIAGIFKNFPLNSLEEEIGGQQISIGTEQDLIQKGTFIQINSFLNIIKKHWYLLKNYGRK